MECVSGGMRGVWGGGVGAGGGVVTLRSTTTLARDLCSCRSTPWSEKKELISDIWRKRGATYGGKGVCALELPVIGGKPFQRERARITTREIRISPREMRISSGGRRGCRRGRAQRTLDCRGGRRRRKPLHIFFEHGDASFERRRRGRRHRGRRWPSKGCRQGGYREGGYRQGGYPPGGCTGWARDARDREIGRGWWKWRQTGKGRAWRPEREWRLERRGCHA